MGRERRMGDSGHFKFMAETCLKEMHKMNRLLTLLLIFSSVFVLPSFGASRGRSGGQSRSSAGRSHSSHSSSRRSSGRSSAGRSRSHSSKKISGHVLRPETPFSSYSVL